MAGQFQTCSDATPNQSSRFADNMQQLLGEDFDPDALFLEESWSLGIPAAAENLHRRRQRQADRGCLQTAAARTHDPRSQSWTPADWVPSDRISHRWIPQGWMPEGVPLRNETPQQSESGAQPWDCAMTLPHAHQLLGVTAASTREQIRSAYRRMVSQWHPDRLQHATEAVRERATQQMADLNEAYRLLCTSPLEDAA